MEATAHGALGDALAWATWYLAPILGLGVSLAYFFTSPRAQPLKHRLLASCAGILIAVIYCAAFAIVRFRLFSPRLGAPFLLLLILPLAAMAFSFRYYRGRRSIQLLQVVNAAALIWTAFIGGMAVTGRWL